MALKFDEMTVDTSLAQEYLKETKDVSELYEDYINSTKTFLKPFVSNGELVTTNQKDVINYAIDAVPSDINISRIQALAASLKQNVTLIAQLEYHIRNIPIEDTKAQLNLIIQHLNCQEAAVSFNSDEKLSFCFYDEPLLKFQTVVHAMIHSRVPPPVALFNMVKATAFITHLFVKLCQKTGFNNIILYFTDGSGPDNKYIETQISDTEIKGYDSGTVAIVSEDSDIDSAVDKLLSVSKQTPWRLRRILVQESVYGLFKNALSWKCNLKKQERKPLDSHDFHSGTLTYKDKSFLIDAVDLPQDQPSVVTVEAYRTRKEMISMIQTDKARYLSLWATDIAEINEVTHNTKSPVVWVNNIADFRGPPAVSTAVFSHLFEPETTLKKCEKASKLYELLKSWQKLDYEARREIVCSVLDKYITAGSHDKVFLKSEILTSTRKSFIDVGKNYVCVGMCEPVGIRAISNSFLSSSYANILNLILNGNGFAIYPTKKNPTSGILEVEISMFEEAGVPLVYIGEYIVEDLRVKQKTLGDRLRVVWTNTGTIFAN